MMIAKCPFCKDGEVTMTKKTIRGRPVKYYACSNTKYETDDGESFYLTLDSTCSFRIFSNALFRWGKKNLQPKEIKTLLNGEDVVVRLYSAQAKKEYYKYVTLHKEYGVSVIWDVDVDPQEIE
jgi:hypothetical protein